HVGVDDAVAVEHQVDVVVLVTVDVAEPAVADGHVVPVEAGGDGRARGRPLVAVAPQAPALADRRVADGDRLVGAAVEVGRAGEALRDDVHATLGDGAGTGLEEDDRARVAVPTGGIAADGPHAGDLVGVVAAGFVRSQACRDP